MVNTKAKVSSEVMQTKKECCYQKLDCSCDPYIKLGCSPTDLISHWTFSTSNLGQKIDIGFVLHVSLNSAPLCTHESVKCVNALFTTEWQINVLETDSLTSDNGTDWMLRTGRVCLFQSCWSDILQDRKRWWHWNQFIYFYARSEFCVCVKLSEVSYFNFSSGRR